MNPLLSLSLKQGVRNRWESKTMKKITRSRIRIRKVRAWKPHLFKSIGGGFELRELLDRGCGHGWFSETRDSDLEMLIAERLKMKNVVESKGRAFYSERGVSGNEWIVRCFLFFLFSIKPTCIKESSVVFSLPIVKQKPPHLAIASPSPFDGGFYWTGRFMCLNQANRFNLAQHIGYFSPIFL